MCYYRNNHYVSCGHHIVIGTRPLRYCAAATPTPAQSSGPGSTATLSALQTAEQSTVTHGPPTPRSSPVTEPPSSPLLTPWHSSPELRTPTRVSTKSLRSAGAITPPASRSRTEAEKTRRTHGRSHGPDKIPCNSLTQHPLTTFKIHNWCPSCLAKIEADKGVIEEVREGLLRAGSVLERALAGDGLRSRDGGERFEWDEFEEGDWRGGLWSLEEELKVLGARIGEVGGEREE